MFDPENVVRDTGGMVVSVSSFLDNLNEFNLIEFNDRSIKYVEWLFKNVRIQHKKARSIFN